MSKKKSETNDTKKCMPGTSLEVQWLRLHLPDTSLVVQWVRLRSPNAGGPGGSLVRELDPAHMPQLKKNRSYVPQLRPGAA